MNIVTVTKNNFPSKNKTPYKLDNTNLKGKYKMLPMPKRKKKKKKSSVRITVTNQNT